MVPLAEIRVPARIENLHALIETITGCARQQGFDQKRIGEIDLSAEEALVNVISYAYGGGEGEVSVVCGLDDGGDLNVEISDSGAPFDILARDEPDTTSALDERQIGGLGIYLMKKLMDDVQYRRIEDRNVLTFRVLKKKD
ncbi:MAG: ATP-binding protein [Nitrospirae bacterium]|nr:ATP-binding protein [Nitrospirota bacterium]